MKNKTLTAKKLLKFLTKLEKRGTNLKKVTINFRENRDSDELQANFVEKDLFDSADNSTLTSIMFLNDNDEDAGVIAVPAKDENYDAFYAFVDDKMVEGDKVARNMIKNFGYRLDFEQLFTFVDGKAMDGDEYAQRLLSKAAGKPVAEKEEEPKDWTVKIGRVKTAKGFVTLTAFGFPSREGTGEMTSGYFFINIKAKHNFENLDDSHLEDNMISARYSKRDREKVFKLLEVKD